MWAGRRFFGNQIRNVLSTRQSEFETSFFDCQLCFAIYSVVRADSAAARSNNQSIKQVVQNSTQYLMRLP
jgi:hypothetical protein